MRDRGPLLAAGILAVVLVGLFLIGEPGNHRPLDPRSNDPAGTSALVRLVRQMGADTTLDVRRLDHRTDVALLLWDRLSARERRSLRSWIRAGGTLVVTDPHSRFAPTGDSFDVLDQDLRNDQADEDRQLETIHAEDCDIAPFTDQDLRTLKVWGSPVHYDVRPGDRSCFGDGDTAYVVDTPVGQGHIVAFGGSGIVVNKTLAKADNAPAIAGLLAPHEGTHAAVVDLRAAAGASTGDKTLRDVMPTSAKRVIVQLALAFLVYVIWRARRLGKPVDEPQPVKVAASELVAATTLTLTLVVFLAPIL